MDKYTFVVATNECGTEITSSRRTEISGAENIIIVQMDPLVQVDCGSSSPLCVGILMSATASIRRSGTAREGLVASGKTRTESPSGLKQPNLNIYAEKYSADVLQFGEIHFETGKRGPTPYFICSRLIYVRQIEQKHFVIWRNTFCHFAILKRQDRGSIPCFIRGRPISVRLIVPLGQIERRPTGKSDNRKSEKSVVR